MEENKTLLGFLGLVAIVNSIFAWGLTTFKLYGWFVQDIFSLPTISYAQAIGLFMFITLLKKHNSLMLKEEYTRSKIERNIFSILSPWVSLGIGWIISLCI